MTTPTPRTNKEATPSHVIYERYRASNFNEAIEWVYADFARQLEQELNEAKLKAAAFEQATQDERNIHMTTIAERDTLKRERDEWKASHDNQVNLRRALMDRPDLKERAELVMKLQCERDEARKTCIEIDLSHRQLEAERDTLKRERDEAKEHLDFLKAKGLTVGLMKTSDKPDPYLVYVAEPNSEFDDTVYVNKLIDVEMERDQLRKVVDELAYCAKNPAIFQRMESIEALSNYSQLPHVKQKENTK